MKVQYQIYKPLYLINEDVTTQVHEVLRKSRELKHKYCSKSLYTGQHKSLR
jgi:hypothetical protein